ncbi:MAG: hypothetical protein ACE5I9_10975, partial [Candidatus Methylomirabilales bacterium]
DLVCQHNYAALFMTPYLDSVILQTLLNDVINVLTPDLVVVGKKGAMGIETIDIKHDYFRLWERVLDGLAEEFSLLLKEESFKQTKRPELKDELLRFLAL